ncbi:MAG: type I-C CRISPR-associated protein Cas7/Csd2 [Lachnospiraceae bacterium]|jgi:CRISPR-associated protein Csd2|nr:type I-C CRISPR-associated protein Cas7/Csd2 [Lachnospiraceae bacterium]
MSEAIKNRYEFVMLYDVENGNPNGDPDAGNMPRLDPETGHGIVTDVCIKRKIRNYVEMVKEGEAGFDIYVQQGKSLNSQDDLGVKAVKEKPKGDEKSLGFRKFMCDHFYDIRTFGAVMTTAAKDKELSNVAGQVRGPVQLAFGKSIDPIVPQEITITRVAITTDEKAETASTEMGRKHIVPYGLYRQEGFVSANLARKITGFNEGDLTLLWEAIKNMFEFDRSAARGKMTLRELIVFKHDSELGNAHSAKLFELVNVKLNDGVKVPRRYEDYTVTVGEAPSGVTICKP